MRAQLAVIRTSPADDPSYPPRVFCFQYASDRGVCSQPDYQHCQSRPHQNLLRLIGKQSGTTLPTKSTPNFLTRLVPVWFQSDIVYVFSFKNNPRSEQVAPSFSAHAAVAETYIICRVERIVSNFTAQAAAGKFSRSSVNVLSLSLAIGHTLFQVVILQYRCSDYFQQPL